MKTNACEFRNPSELDMSTVNTLFPLPMPFVVGPSAGAQRYATSEAQLEVWLSSQQSAEANCAYNEISSLILTGAIDVNVLTRAIDEVVQRHCLLRATFSQDGQEVVLHESLPFEFECLDFIGFVVKSIGPCVDKGDHGSVDKAF